MLKDLPSGRFSGINSDHSLKDNHKEKTHIEHAYPILPVSLFSVFLLFSFSSLAVNDVLRCSQVDKGMYSA